MPTGRIGTEFHGEFSSADASALNEANSRITLYPAATVSALTLGATDQVVITSIQLTSAGAVTVTLYDGADATVDAGEAIALAGLAANGFLNLSSDRVPHYCQAGTYPKVKASGAGAIKVIIRGWIESR
jgi:hypothetical protein